LGKETEQATGTHRLGSADRVTGQSGKGTERAMGTHILERTDRGTSQIEKRNRASDGHSPTGEGRQRGESK
jgi:hypothetical protein